MTKLNKTLKMNRTSKKILLALIILSIIAMIDASYLTYTRYSPSTSSFCDVGKNFSCSVVNKSVYSTLFGIPVALLGFLTFLIIFLLSLSAYSSKPFLFSRKVSARVILVLLFVSVLFSSWLIYVQKVLLMSYCILCLFLDLIIFTSFILTIFLNSQKNFRSLE